MATWTTPSTWAAAAVVTAAQLNTQLRDNMKTIGDPWTTYVPTYTNVTIGNATVTAKYMQPGKLVIGEVKITIGSTTSITGAIQVSLPAAASIVPNHVIGSVYMFDTSASANKTGVVITQTTGGTAFIEASGTVVAAAVPFTWAVGDVLSFSLMYEAA